MIAITDSAATHTHTQTHTQHAQLPPHLGRIPDDIRCRLTPEQAEHLAALLAVASPRRHTLAYRASTRLFGRRLYLAIFSGAEHRTPSRVRDDGIAVSGLGFLFRILFVCGWVTVAALVSAIAGAVLLYLVKSYLGIDLMDGPSPLHRFFF